ncbi:hypothetical protein H5410_016001 [Solanum commersonii]|uniref:Uncharacterized protein n=1 Tax=Solanum commersonii TaxID=4109 RepID=A0A9J5ZV97_SOLCO|nr:hypothetical protein H5410_016001 [Solanum commersonii]
MCTCGPNPELQQYCFNLTNTNNLRLGTRPEWDHRTGTGLFDRVVDQYRDKPDRNYRNGGSVPSRPTKYRDRTGMDRNGPEWNGMG